MSVCNNAFLWFLYNNYSEDTNSEQHDYFVKEQNDLNQIIEEYDYQIRNDERIILDHRKVQVNQLLPSYLYS
jgi:hypothetical protein